MKILTLLSLFLPLFGWSQNATEPIIDMHLHDYTERSYFVAPSRDGTMSPPTLEAYREAVFAELKKHNVVHAVVSTIGGENTLDSDGVLIPGYYCNEAPEDTLKFIELIESGKLKVFGEIGAVYVGNTLSDPEYAPYLSICERYDIPVAIHTGGGPSNITKRLPNFRLRYGDPLTIEDVLVKYPKLRVYMMHAGEVFFEHALRLMTQYPTLYTDLGVLLWVHEQPMDYAERFLRKAKEHGLMNRVMFGSDQMVWPHAIGLSIEKLNSFDFLSEEDKRKILYHNAHTFLRLEE